MHLNAHRCPPAQWPTGDYHISLESPEKYGKTETGRAEQAYIYGMSARFSVLYTAGSLYFREPRENAEWKFDQVRKSSLSLSLFYL